MIKLLLFIPILVLFGCRKPVANGAFVGKWYALNYEDGQEYWEITDENEVIITDTIRDTLLNYILEYSEAHEHYHMVSSNLQDTVGFMWIETPAEFPPKITPDTIRFYHSFTLVRNNNLPVTDFSKKEIVETLENSSWQFDWYDSKISYFLTDSVIDGDNKRAYVKSKGCFEYYSDYSYWSLDTLTNNIVLKVKFLHYEELFFIKEFSKDNFLVDRDEFYWFRKNIRINKTDIWDNDNLSELDLDKFFDCFE